MGAFLNALIDRYEDEDDDDYGYDEEEEEDYYE